MRLFGYHINSEDYRTLYEIACEERDALHGRIEELDRTVEFWRAKAADASYNVDRLNLDLEAMKVEMEDLRLVAKKKASPDVLHDFAERLRVAEEKAGKYDRYIKGKRARDRRYRLSKASRR